jgi:hypothetical protein
VSRLVLAGALFKARQSGSEDSQESGPSRFWFPCQRASHGDDGCGFDCGGCDHFSVGCGFGCSKKEAVVVPREVLFVGHFVNLLFHHVPPTVNQSFRDAGNSFGCVFYVGCELERDGAEGAGWDEFDFDYAGLFLFHVCYHLHFGEGHARFWVLDLANFLADLVFKLGQTVFHTNV